MGLDKSFSSILWEYDLKNLRLDSQVVVERVLNLGDEKVTNLWIKNLGKERAKELFIKYSKLLDKKSFNYWKIYFGVKNKKIISDNRTMYEKLNTPIFTRSFG